MKLLIITQKVDMNDGVLGFFHGWLKEFAKHCEKITVICLQKGEYDLPENVRVFSLGKEKQLRERTDLGNLKKSVLGEQWRKIKYALNFYKYIWRERKNYESVFVHMNPVYVILGGLFWKGWRKKIALWYTHKNVDWKLRMAEKLVDKIFTASKESFRLSSKKVEITGHGIDTEKFKPAEIKKENSKLKIITAGRIAEIKNLHIMPDVAEILRNKNFDFEIKIAGAPILEADKIYFDKLGKKIKEKKLEDKIKFIGPISNKDIADFYQEGDLFINLSDTGSLDKAVLEAMSCGVLVATSNEAFKDVFGNDARILIFPSNNPRDIAGQILETATLNRAEKDKLAKHLRDIVVKRHNIEALISRISSYYETSQ